MLVIAKSLLLQVQLEPFDLQLGYCDFYFPHTCRVGGLVQRQLNELRRVQQVSYLLLFCRRSSFNSQTGFLSKDELENRQPMADCRKELLMEIGVSVSMSV